MSTGFKAPPVKQEQPSPSQLAMQVSQNERERHRKAFAAGRKKQSKACHKCPEQQEDER
jgi:hypothetical protein